MAMQFGASIGNNPFTIQFGITSDGVSTEVIFDVTKLPCRFPFSATEGPTVSTGSGSFTLVGTDLRPVANSQLYYKYNYSYDPATFQMHVIYSVDTSKPNSVYTPPAIPSGLSVPGISMSFTYTSL